MIHIKEGTFTIGDIYGDDRPDAKPTHTVTWPDFRIGKYYQFYPKEGEEPEWDNLKERSLRIRRGASFKEGRPIASTYWRPGCLKMLKNMM